MASATTPPSRSRLRTPISACARCWRRCAAWTGDLADFEPWMFCGANMTKTVAEKLSDLVRAVGELPEDTQEVLVEEFLDRLTDFTNATLSDEQRAEISRR